MNIDLSENPYKLHLEFGEIIDEFEKRGFWFYLDWTVDEPVIPERVKLPSGKIFDRAELAKEDSDEAREGENYLKLVDTLDLDDKDKRYSASFRDDEDVAKMRMKYPPA